MSVPRPAMLVAIVTAPGTPACATMLRFLLVVAGVEDLMRDRIVAGLGLRAELDEVDAHVGRGIP